MLWQDRVRRSDRSNSWTPIGPIAAHYEDAYGSGYDMVMTHVHEAC